MDHHQKALKGGVNNLVKWDIHSLFSQALTFYPTVLVTGYELQSLTIISHSEDWENKSN